MFKVAHKDKTPPQITKHLLGKKKLALVTKHLHRSKTILLILKLSQITRHSHKYETPPQITKHLHANNLSNSNTCSGVPLGLPTKAGILRHFPDRAR